MFDYNIHKDNSPKIFKETCEKIRNQFPNSIEQKLLVDVDGSTVQTFTLNGKDIDIYDDYDVGAVYVKSEIELSFL